MRKDFVMPVLVLFCICLVISAALAVTNAVTAPIIAESEAEAAEAARLEVLPQAGEAGFEALTLEGLPDTVTEVYRAVNGAGYVFMLSAQGYGGEMQLACGIDADCKITACQTLSHSETAGMGSKTADAPFRDQFIGQGEDLSGVEAISGATVSSEAYIGAIQDAFTAFKLAKEAA